MRRTGLNALGGYDLCGVAASVACAIHCAALSLILATLPAWGLSWLADKAFHRWMALLLVCMVFAVGRHVLRTAGQRESLLDRR